MTTRTFKPFDYLPELGCFVVNEEYEEVARYLGLVEWNAVVWIGRYFCMDNDFGEHWFDNWDARAAIGEQAAQLGYDESELLIIVPSRHQDGQDGPCHPEALRAHFWHEVLTSLTFSLDLLVAEARHSKAEWDRLGYTEDNEQYVADLEQRILQLTSTD